MRGWAKFIVIALVVAFAATSAVQIAQAAAMDIQMSMASDSGCGCPDCPEGPDAKGVNCTADCVTSSIALPAFEVIALHIGSLKSPAPVYLSDLADWHTPPDPFPPRHVL